MKRYKNCRFRNLNHRSTICQHFCQWTNILALSPTLACSWATLFEEKSILNLYLIFEKRSLQKEIRITHKNCKTYLPDSELKCVFYICVLHVFVSPTQRKTQLPTWKTFPTEFPRFSWKSTWRPNFAASRFITSMKHLKELSVWQKLTAGFAGDSCGWKMENHRGELPIFFGKIMSDDFFWWKHKSGGLLESCLWLTDASLHLWVIKYH